MTASQDMRAIGDWGTVRRRNLSTGRGLSDLGCKIGESELNIVRTGLAALAMLLMLYAAAPSANDHVRQGFSEQLSRQQKIYHSEDEKSLENYIVDRTLQSYTQALSADFERALASLGSTDRWLDIGAGRGQAILDYYSAKYERTRKDGTGRKAGKARAIAMSIEDRRSFLWQQKLTELDPDQIRYLHGRRLEDYRAEELGLFQLITDVVGGFSYALDLSRFLEKVLGILEVNGSFHTFLQDVRSEVEKNQPFYENARFLTEISSANDSEVRVCTWLKSISCVEVSCEFKVNWRPHIEVYHLRKACNEVVVPALLPLRYEAGTPPERGYRLTK